MKMRWESLFYPTQIRSIIRVSKGAQRFYPAKWKIIHNGSYLMVAAFYATGTNVQANYTCNAPEWVWSYRTVSILPATPK